MLKKSLVFIIFILFIMTGCIEKKESVVLKNETKFEKMISEIKEYKKNISRTTTVAVQDGIYIKSGAIYDFYSLSKLDSLTFQEKVALLEKIDKVPTAVTVVVSDFAKSFYDYVSLEDLLVTGTNATSAIGMYTTVYDIGNGKYLFAIGEGIAQPVIGSGGGNYTEPQAVALTCSTAGVNIRYTTDGTEPVSTSLLYSSELIIDTTTTIKAKAYSSDGFIESNTVSATYTINSGGVVEKGFSYAGKKYMGKTTEGSGSALMTSSSFINVTEPLVSNFDCDGYFELKGVYTGITNMRYFYVSVKKTSTSESTNYFIEGPEFNKKIWLRYGAGEYKVKIYIVLLTTNVAIKEPYDGDIVSYSVQTTTSLYSYVVNNTRDEDGRFLYPSNFIQSDEKAIYDTAVEELTKANAINGTIEEKSLVLHNYIVRKLTYDDSSLTKTQRKRQDAISCLNSGLAVCEGYTSLYNALLRSQGIQAKAILGMDSTHAWSNVFDGTIWRLVDTTWDDPDVEGKINIAYFWLENLTGRNGEHTVVSDRPYRNMEEKEVSIFMNSKEGEY